MSLLLSISYSMYWDETLMSCFPKKNIGDSCTVSTNKLYEECQAADGVVCNSTGTCECDFPLEK